MSWDIINKSQTGTVQYMSANYDTTLNAATSNSLNVVGYGQGNVIFTCNGAMTATLHGSLDGNNYFTITSLLNPPTTGAKLSWDLPIKYIKVGCTANTISNIYLLAES